MYIMFKTKRPGSKNPAMGIYSVLALLILRIARARAALCKLG